VQRIEQFTVTSSSVHSESPGFQLLAILYNGAKLQHWTRECFEIATENATRGLLKAEHEKRCSLSTRDPDRAMHRLTLRPVAHQRVEQAFRNAIENEFGATGIDTSPRIELYRIDER
jgi:hypothetical protein